MSKYDGTYHCHVHVPSLVAYSAFFARTICDEFCLDNPTVNTSETLRVRSRFDQRLMDWLEDFYLDLRRCKIDPTAAAVSQISDTQILVKSVDAFWLMVILYSKKNLLQTVAVVYDDRSLDLYLSVFCHCLTENLRSVQDPVAIRKKKKRLMFTFLDTTRKCLNCSTFDLNQFKYSMQTVCRRLRPNVSDEIFTYILSSMLLSFPQKSIRTYLVSMGARENILMENHGDAQKMIIASGTGQYDYVAATAIADLNAVNNSPYISELDAPYSAMSAAIEADDVDMIHLLFDLGAHDRSVHIGELSTDLESVSNMKKCEICRGLLRGNINALQAILYRTASWYHPHLYMAARSLESVKFLYEYTKCPILYAIGSCTDNIKKLVYVVKVLSRHSSNMKDPLVRRALMKQTDRFDIELLDFILNLPTFTEEDFMDMVYLAIASNDGRRLRRLLSSDISKTGNIASSDALGYAAEVRNIGVSELLLSAGCSINSRDPILPGEEPLTPLMRFCSSSTLCDTSSVLNYLKWLLRNGCNVMDETGCHDRAIDFLKSPLTCPRIREILTEEMRKKAVNEEQVFLVT